jgi:hypothetical protein
MVNFPLESWVKAEFLGFRMNTVVHELSVAVQLHGCKLGIPYFSFYLGLVGSYHAMFICSIS